MDGTDRETTFQRERRHLLAVAFRLLGSDADAQDAVQEAWTRYAAADLTGVRNVPAWLTTVVTRLCLDVLRRSRERPYAPGALPGAYGPADAEAGGPEDVALLAGELTEALAIVVDELTPPQRVALVLHDVFGMAFHEIAHVLETTPASAKKLASRARARVRSRTTGPPADPAAARRVVAAFLRAAQEGDVDGLVSVLDPDVTRTADPQAMPYGAAQWARGAHRVAEEIALLRGAARRARLITADGRPAIALGPAASPGIVITFHIRDARVRAYDVIADPSRLAGLHLA